MDCGVNFKLDTMYLVLILALVLSPWCVAADGNSLDHLLVPSGRHGLVLKQAYLHHDKYLSSAAPKRLELYKTTVRNNTAHKLPAFSADVAIDCLLLVNSA